MPTLLAWMLQRLESGRTPWPSAPRCLEQDVRMPGTTGQVLFERLSERGLLRLLPEIFPTGHGDVPAAVAAVERWTAPCAR